MVTTEIEPTTPEQRASITLYVAEHYPTYDYMIADRTGLGLRATVSALEGMTASGELVRPYGADYRPNRTREAEIYADAMPHASTEHLMRLSTLGEGTAARQLFISGERLETRWGALRLAAKVEMYARMKRAERLEQRGD